MSRAIDLTEAIRQKAAEAIPSSETLTDSGNASRLINMYGDRLHYVPAWGRWFVCDANTGYWTLDYRDIQVRELAKEVGKRLKLKAAEMDDRGEAEKLFRFALRSLNARGITGMVDLSRGIAGIPLDHENFDRNGWRLGVVNGVVDLQTGAFRPVDPRDLMTLHCAVEWDEKAVAPRWERAMEEWFPDPEVREYVQRVAGSALIGTQREHVFVIHYGLGRNGKGTFIRALTRVLGPYASVIHLSLLIESKYTGHDTVKADLFRSRLAIASETARRVRLDEASVKNLTGGDRITARRMREDPWEFDPTHSLWLQTNHLPEIGGRDTGIWSRIRVVKWENTFEGSKQDQGLDEVLAAEGPGILRWLVEGCLEWQAHGLHEPDKVVRDTFAYRQSEDVFSCFLRDTGLAFRAGLEIEAGELQNTLGEWADVEGVNVPKRDVGDWLRENGCTQSRPRRTGRDGKRRQVRVWHGVGFEKAGHVSKDDDT